MLTTEQAEKLTQALDVGDEAALQAQLPAINVVDIADFIVASTDSETAASGILYCMDVERAAELLGHFPLNLQRGLAEAMPPEHLARLVTRMSADERADLVPTLDVNVRHALFKRLAREEREDLRRLASYEEGSAGAIMTSDYAAIPVDTSVHRALEYLRNTAPDQETIYQCYVVDEGHRLLGTVSLRELMVAPPGRPIEALMVTEPIAGQPDMAQEEVYRLITRYDLLALPIVSEEGRLVGIVTYDDAMDVAEAEATEDMHKSATVGKLDTALVEASPLSLYRSRVSWLVVLVFANIFTGAGIAYFEELIASHLALLFFMPLLVASAGNAGAQSATLTIRGLATGEVQANHWLRMVGKEIGVATALGLTMALAVMSIGYFRAGIDIATVVAATMIIVVLFGSLIGLCLPFVLQLFRIDPATASTPLITTIADVGGVLIYFGIATLMLGLD